LCTRGSVHALARGPSTSPLDAMVRTAVLLGALALATPVVAADSVVLGHGVSNAFLSKPPCPEHSLCMDALYIWVLDADHTVVGPSVTGTVRAIATQHTDATTQFARSVELFVLSPITNPTLRKSSGARFYLISFSPRDSQGRYCISVNPNDVGLKLDPAEVSVDSGSGGFCFKASVLASNNRWRGP
jgi:hypothetical protein